MSTIPISESGDDHVRDETFFVPRPGAAGPWRSLQAATRAVHERTAATIAQAIRERTEKGVSLDDRTDWQSDVAAELAAYKSAPDRAAARAALERAHAVASDGLTMPPAYVDDPRLDGVELRVRAVSQADVLVMRAAIASSATDADRHRAIRPFVRQTLAGVRGLDVGAVRLLHWDIDRTSTTEEVRDAVVDLIDEAGLLVAVFSVCRDYQQLSPLERRGFGLPHPSTSGTSTAARAQPTGESTLAATATPSSQPTREPPTKPTGVHDVVSSMFNGAARPSTSTTPATAASPARPSSA